MEDLKCFLDIQAKELSNESFLVRSKIIDMSLKKIHLNRYKST